MRRPPKSNPVREHIHALRETQKRLRKELRANQRDLKRVQKEQKEQ